MSVVSRRFRLLPDWPPMPIICPRRRGSIWRPKIRDFGHVIVFSGQITQVRHPGSCAVLPKVGLTTCKSASPSHKAVFEKLKVL